MNAGLLTYKLCDRGFDCEHCPLDAALHGASPAATPLREVSAEPTRGMNMTFPADRVYSAGHTWLQHLDAQTERFRFGLDAFATALIACPHRVRWNLVPRELRRGETICAIDFNGGSLLLGAPVMARLCGRNEALDDDPAAIVTAPYGEGWIADLTRVAESDSNGLLSAEAGEEQARLDMRRFRRRIALHLLAEAGSIGALADSGMLMSDPRCILGSAHYLELVRELVH